jgi:surface antigen
MNKAWLIILVLCGCVASAVFAKPDPKAAGLPQGQCTWYAFLCAQQAGWNIQFDKPYDRHATKWWDKVTNAEKTTEPKAGAIMVLDAWEGNPYGHVAYVEKVINSNEWIVTHANFAVGTAATPMDEIPVYRVKCQKTKAGILLEGRQQIFTLKGFLSAQLSKKS